jgi:SAM-dependent methyltransferase
MMHVPDRARVLSEVARVLRPGGCLALTDFCLLGDPLDAVAGAAVDLFCATFHVNPTLYPIDRYRDLVAAAGFEVEHVTPIDDDRCKGPTLRLLASRLAGSSARQDALPAEVLRTMAAACEGFAAVLDCGLLILVGRRSESSA